MCLRKRSALLRQSPPGSSDGASMATQPDVSSGLTSAASPQTMSLPRHVLTTGLRNDTNDLNHNRRDGLSLLLSRATVTLHASDLNWIHWRSSLWPCPRTITCSADIVVLPSALAPVRV